MFKGKPCFSPKSYRLCLDIHFVNVKLANFSRKVSMILHVSSSDTHAHNSAHTYRKDTDNSVLLRNRIPLKNDTSPHFKPIKLPPLQSECGKYSIKYSIYYSIRTVIPISTHHPLSHIQKQQASLDDAVRTKFFMGYDLFRKNPLSVKHSLTVTVTKFDVTSVIKIWSINGFLQHVQISLLSLFSDDSVVISLFLHLGE